MSLSQFFFPLLLLLQLYLSSFTHCTIPFFSFFFLLWFALPLLSCRPNVSPHVSLTMHLVCAVTSYTREVTAQSSVCTATGKTPHTASSALKKLLTLCKRVFFSALWKLCALFSNIEKSTAPPARVDFWRILYLNSAFFSKQKISSLLECLRQTVACKTKQYL